MPYAGLSPPDDDRSFTVEIEEAASKIQERGGRYSEASERMTNL